MIGLDTNVLVRYLVQDDPRQSARAARLLESRCTASEPGFVNRIVLCETVWVLKRAYGYERQVISDVIERLLQTAELEVEDAQLAWRALKSYRAQAVGFADALVAEINLRKGCEGTASFDKRANKMDGFFAA